MDITPFVDSLRHDLAQAAEVAGPEHREAAERMALALEPALRLTLLEALSQAAAEITAELPAGQVDVRLRGRDPELVVDVPAAQPESVAPEPAADEDDDEVIARVSLRIPESVKLRAEEQANRNGQSLNSWIVAVLRRASSPRFEQVTHDLTSRPVTSSDPGRTGAPRRVHGWA